MDEDFDLPPVSQLSSCAWICMDNSQCGAFAVVQHPDGCTFEKLAGNSWWTFWSIAAIKGLQYFEIEFSYITGSPMLGLMESITEKHLTAWNPAPQTLHLDSFKANFAPWEIHTDGVTIHCGRAARLIPGGSIFNKDERIGFLVDFFSDKIDLYRQGAFITTLTTGISKFKNGLHFVTSVHYQGNKARIYSNVEKPKTIQEIEAIMLKQQDYLRKVRSEIIALRQKLANREQSESLNQEEIRNLRSQLQTQEQLLEQFRRGSVYHPSSHIRT